MVTSEGCFDLSFSFPSPLSYAAMPRNEELGQKCELFLRMFWLLYQLKNKVIKRFHSFIRELTSLNKTFPEECVWYHFNKNYK